MNHLKEQLWLQCQQIIEQRLATAQQAMNAAQESANQEEKSSAGDKYETARAMAQLERDKAAMQVEENKKMLIVLNQIRHHSSTETVTLGSIVVTDRNKFYVSISAGKLEIGGECYMAISTQSPIGQLLLYKRTGEFFNFNNQTQNIISVS
ncbi:MAG: 3-oxoacyl-ACP synthase [Cyclobacteriaceae bacterium]|nr:3-oxoacyl-ACP synthase [Cyclobacteriaceae bacterium]